MQDTSYSVPESIQAPLLSLPITAIEDSEIFDIHPFRKNRTPSPTLLASINQYGIITPPTLLDIGNGKYDIICGRQRIVSLQESGGAATLFCRVFPADCNRESLLRFMVVEQSTTGALTLLEQACFLQLCQKLIPDDGQRLFFLKQLPEGIITKGHNFLSQFFQISNTIKHFIDQGLLADGAALFLTRFHQQEQLLLADLVKNLHLGLNKQKKLLAEIFDITRREDISVQTLLQSLEVQNILGDSRKGTPQKSQMLFDYLFITNHPLQQKAKRHFDETIRSLQLPRGCTIHCLENFERDEVTLTVRFKDLDELRKAWKDVKRALPEEA